MTKKVSRRFFHVPKGVPYSVENSYIGLWAAWRKGFKWIDVDLHVTKDGEVIAAHWAHPRQDGFILPAWFKDKYGPDPMIRDVVWADLQKLRSAPRSYYGKTFVNQYRTAKEMMAQAKRLGLSIEFEPKGDRDFGVPGLWLTLAGDAIDVGLPTSRIEVKTLTSIPGWKARLEAAHPWFVTIVLPRNGAVIPRSAERYIDGVRGNWKRGPVGS